ncbi:MAG: helix-turn-helix domain-containing protein [Candidatus Hodarchaeota archaeon]
MLEISGKLQTTSQKESGSVKSVAEVLSDPIRVTILFQAFTKGEITQQTLQNSIKLSRSTLSHHLKILVDAGLLTVRVNPTGRPIKHYKLCESCDLVGLNKETLQQSSVEEGSQQVYQLLKSLAIHYQLFAQNSLNTLESIKESIPFSSIDLDQEEGVYVTLKDKKVWIPNLLSIGVAGEKEVKYLTNKIFEILTDLKKECSPEDDSDTSTDSSKVKYLFLFGAFPSFS